MLLVPFFLRKFPFSFLFREGPASFWNPSSSSQVKLESVQWWKPGWSREGRSWSSLTSSPSHRKEPLCKVCSKSSGLRFLQSPNRLQLIDACGGGGKGSGFAPGTNTPMQGRNWVQMSSCRVCSVGYSICKCAHICHYFHVQSTSSGAATLFLPRLENLDALRLISLRELTRRTLFALSRYCSLILAYTPHMNQKTKHVSHSRGLILDLEYSKASVHARSRTSWIVEDTETFNSMSSRN